MSLYLKHVGTINPPFIELQVTNITMISICLSFMISFSLSRHFRSYKNYQNNRGNLPSKMFLMHSYSEKEK